MDNIALSLVADLIASRSKQGVFPLTLLDRILDKLTTPEDVKNLQLSVASCKEVETCWISVDDLGSSTLHVVLRDAAYLKGEEYQTTERL